MEQVKIGYARVSTTGRELASQRDGLVALGVEPEQIYADYGLTGTNRERPGLASALAACRAGDELVVTRLDRLARSIKDACSIAEKLTGTGATLNLGGAVYDPADPAGKLMFNVLAMVAEFEADVIRQRTREGLAVARAAGRLRGRRPKLSPHQEARLLELHQAGEKTTGQLAELFGIGRSTVWRIVQRSGRSAAQPAPAAVSEPPAMVGPRPSSRLQ